MKDYVIKEMKQDLLPEKSHRTVLPPTKFIASSESSRVSSLVPDLRIFHEEQINRLSKIKHSNQLEQRLGWTLTDSGGNLSSGGSLDRRMVLPKTSLIDGNSQRKVVLPQGKSKSRMSTEAEEELEFQKLKLRYMQNNIEFVNAKSKSQLPTGASMQQSHTTSFSPTKLATTKRACEEELEFLKLKLRYMQNDIEFKRNQINSVQTSQPKSRPVSQNWNRDNLVSDEASSTRDAKIISSSNSYNLLQNKIHSKSSATNWTSPAACSQQTTADLSYQHSSLQGKRNLSTHVLTKMNKSLLVTNSNNSSTVYSWPSNYAPKTIQTDTLRPDSSPAVERVVYTKCERTEPNYFSSEFINNTSHIPGQHLYLTQNQVTPTQTDQTTSSVYSVGAKVIQDEFKTKIPITQILTAKPTPSAFERLGNHRHTDVPKSFYISPDKRLVLISSKTAPSVLMSAVLPCTINQTASAPTVVVSSSVNMFTKTQLDHVPNLPHSTSINDLQSKESSMTTGSTISLSKYKLVKNPSSLPSDTIKASTTSSSLFSLPPHTGSNIYHDFPSFPLQPTKAATALRRASQSSRLSVKLPNLKVQTAAKLVSKYKIKRLSPTSSSQLAPLFYNKTQSRKSSLQYQQENYNKTLNHYNKNLHKLDRRQINNGSTTPKIGVKHFTSDMYNTNFIGLTRKYNAERHAILNQRSNTTRYSQQLSRSRLKIDKRAQRSNVFLDKLYHEKIPNLLDKSFECESDKLKVSSKQTELDQNKNNDWTHDDSIRHSAAGRDSTRMKRYASKYNWKMAASMLHSKSSQLSASAKNSRFKWSRPATQVQNSSWQQLRQKLQLLLNKKHKHSRFTFSRYPLLTAASVNYSKSGQIGDYKSNLVTIDGITYKSSKRKLTRTRRSSSSSSAKKAASVQISRSMGTLKSASSSSVPTSTRRNISSHANRAVHRSIAIAAAKYRKNNHKSKIATQHCIFFGRFGKCHRGDKCPFIHDPEQVAVCTRFLRGKCDTKSCPFSHKASVNKIPVCLFYLRGSCCRENCPYIHVRVNPNASVCKDFRNGFCSLGEKCKKIHSYVCPSFAMTGKCSRFGTCTMLHRTNKRELDGSSSQAKPLSLNTRKRPERDLKRCVSQVSRESQPLKSEKSIFTPASSMLTAQPSFISLEINPMPSFISLETKNQNKDGEKEREIGHQGQQGLSVNKDGVRVLNVAQQNSTKDVMPSIRPSFLAKKFVENKTAQQTSQTLPQL